jgi:hypothetical protein
MMFKLAKQIVSEILEVINIVQASADTCLICHNNNLIPGLLSGMANIKDPLTKTEVFDLVHMPIVFIDHTIPIQK